MERPGFPVSYLIPKVWVNHVDDDDDDDSEDDDDSNNDDDDKP